MASRARQHRKNKMAGNTRMDAALDAMRQFGFARQVVRETVKELLEVYDGTQGWPFIEEASYKLLIETILSKQGSAEDRDDARRDGVNETSTAGVSEVGSSGLVAQDTLLHTSDCLDSSSQANDQDHASLGNLETDVKDSAVQADRGGHEQGVRVESKNELKPADYVKGSNDSTFVNNVESTFVKTPVIQSSKAFDHLPCRRREGYHGWIGNGSDDDDMELIHFPIPPLLSKQIEKMTGQDEPLQSGSRRRRKSRWDEKPDGM
ncbi:histone-lysine N-methyltransferase [Spatholobus suberectus]|nr:histone-lysine N-methyltransferase [Spatholobus suberectus]